MRLRGISGIKDKKTSKKIIAGELRRTQLITTYGPGAIADFPDNCSVVMASIDEWKQDGKGRIGEPRLERLLGVSGFMEPAFTAGENGPEKGLAAIPSWRFPLIGFCTACGRLGEFQQIGRRTGRKYFCKICQDKNNKNSPLLPSRFVTACINGHLADFPYGWWVHHPDMRSCPDAWGKNLEIQFTGKSGGLDSIIIRCRTCNTERSMAGCLGKEALKGFRCGGRMPWINPDKRENCDAVPRGMQRGASGVWFSLTASALTLPSGKTRIQKAVSEKWDKLQSLDLNLSGDRLETILEYEFNNELAKKIFTVKDVLAEVRAKRLAHGTEHNEKQYSVQDLFEDEYAVLSTHEGGPDDAGDTNFHATLAEIPHALSPYFSRVLLINRLREVMALYGFRRITPEEVAKGNPEFPGYTLEKGYVPLGETKKGTPSTPWLPAVEMLGEGIFLQLREDTLEKWERQVHARYDRMAAKLAESNVGCPNFSSRYVLLHTLSHLLIRQLTLECGYSGASIRERIYSTFPESEKPMAGIVLYTSSTDADGSLGGLVRNGNPKNLERIFLNMLREATWCSTDPVCSESLGQGFSGLNYAACHACTLLPETSCSMRNCLLDRIAITGATASREIGFFHKLLHS